MLIFISYGPDKIIQRLYSENDKLNFFFGGLSLELILKHIIFKGIGYYKTTQIHLTLRFLLKENNYKITSLEVNKEINIFYQAQ